MNYWHRCQETLYRFAASGWVSPRWFLPEAPQPNQLAARTGRLKLEIVSHCWKYAHLQDYQLSSLVLHPPQDCDVTMTVFHCPEDQKTVDLLKFFEPLAPANVTWNWQPLLKGELFRRGIGRNRAAKATQADWIWFTDCDQLFHKGCLDAMNSVLQGRQDLLVFPTKVSCTRMLEDDNQVLTATSDPAVADIDPNQFEEVSHGKAVGALQIFHGDVARSTGYCDAIKFYQQPVDRWQKTFEDRAVRWLLGTHGVPIDVPGIFRIEHVHKGRYASKDGQPNLTRRIAAKIAPRSVHRIGKGQRDAA